MSSSGKVYFGAVLSAGAVAFAAGHYHWHSPDPVLFLLLLAFTAFASAVKVRLPGITGTMSLSFVLLLFSVIELSSGEVVDIAIVSALVQCFWKAQKRPGWISLGYNNSLMILSTIAAYGAYHVWPPSTSLVVTISSAVCAYFLVNTLCVAAAIALTENKSFIGVWREFYLWSLPFYLFGGSLAAAMTFLTRFNWEIGLAVLPLVVITYRTYRVQVKQLEEQKRHAEDITALHVRTIETLALAVEAKDQTTADHLKRVQVYTGEISKLLQLSGDEQKALQAAAILHDVGKIAVPDYIISKPGRLTPDEFQRMKIHPIVGAEIAERIHFPYPVAPIIRAHHEKWDGSGYPYGLRGQEIPIGARILSVVDCFDALASDRQYRKALPLDEAMAVVEREAGKSFDPEIVHLLAQHYLELEKLAVAQLAPEQPHLSLDVWVGPGESPDAGFESAGPYVLPAAILDDFDQASFDTHSLSLQETLAVQSCRVAALVPCEAVVIYLLDGGRLKPGYVWGLDSERLSRLRIPLGEGVAGWVAENHQSILNGNPAVEPGYAQAVPGAGALRSVLAVPLQTDAETLGVLAVYSAKPDGFTRATLDRIRSVSGKLAAVIGRAREKEAGSGSSTAYTTGLPDSGALFSFIDAEIAKGQSDLAILHCQVAGIAEIHQTFGRESANETLRAIAQALRETCRSNDYLAQTSEDEFALLLPGSDLGMAQSVIESLRLAVQQVGLRLWGADLISLKAGAACFPDHAGSAQTLLSAARRATMAVDAPAHDDLASLASLASSETPAAREPIPTLRGEQIPRPA